MPSLSDTRKQVDELLNEVLQIVWDDYGGLNPVLTEVDRQRFVQEEESLREHLNEASKPESTSWRISSFLSGWPPSQAIKAEKCLEEARGLRSRVKDEMNEEVRRRATGRGVPPSTSFFDFMGAAREDAGRSLPDESNVEPAFHNERTLGIRPNIAERPSPLSQLPRQLETTPSPATSPSPSPAQTSFDPTFPAAQDVNTLPLPQAPEWPESASDNNMTNCISMSNSHTVGLTLHNGGTQNSGSAIHQIVSPQSPQPVANS